MALKMLCCALIVLSISYCRAEFVPVFMWGAIDGLKSYKSDPLSLVNEDQFSTLLTKEIEKDPFVVVFVEENLSVEDFSRKDDNGLTPFEFLHSKLGESVYIPSVHSALDAITKVGGESSANHVKLTDDGLSADLESSGRFLVINLNDAHELESRSDMLKRHDDFMQEMFNKLVDKYSDVVAVYTSRYPSWYITRQEAGRVRRSADQKTPYYNASKLLLYLNSASITPSGSVEVIELGDVKDVKIVSSSATLVTAKITYENYTVTLNYTTEADYWFLNSVKVVESSGTEHTLTSSVVYAKTASSYHCSSSITFKGENNTLKLTNLQMQPFFSDDEADMFGPAYDCIGFFSVPIWSGLFIVILLLFITFYGVCMMMDINTMDRFDDPKGKTITISATE